jgi:hypothetical protein
MSSTTETATALTSTRTLVFIVVIYSTIYSKSMRASMEVLELIEEKGSVIVDVGLARENCGIRGRNWIFMVDAIGIRNV